jgi:hypothetical protein
MGTPHWDEMRKPVEFSQPLNTDLYHSPDDALLQVNIFCIFSQVFYRLELQNILMSTMH